MAVINAIDYITFATPSNASDFGDLTEATSHASALSDGTKGLRGGDLSAAHASLAGASNATRGVFTGGQT